MIEFITANFNFLLNKVLRLDPELHEQLNKFANKCMHIEITNIPLPSFYILFNANNIVLTTTKQEVIDVYLSANSSTLAKVFIKKLTKDNSLPENINMSGDVEFAQNIFQFFNQFEIDWEEQIAKLFGDAIASHVGQGIRNLTQYTRNTLDIFSQNIREYFQEEASLLTTRLEIEDFHHEIDHLRIDTDRLAARIQRLENETT